MRNLLQNAPFVALLATLLAAASAGLLSGAGSAGASGSIPLNLDVSILNTTADPSFFHTVTPGEYDPAHTDLVQGGWLNGIGCPTGASVATYPATTPTGTYTDSACTTGDSKDQHNEGLLLVKTGPTGNNAAAVAELKSVKGITLTELGYDIRKSAMTGSHCGAGAPRFDVVDSTGTIHFVGCSSPPPLVTAASDGWMRLRWTSAQLLLAFPPISTATVVSRIVIVFDEGQDLGPADSFGAAILDNIDVNGTLVGHGDTNAS